MIPDLLTLARILRTFFLVCLGWLFFRADTFTDALTICARIVSGLITPYFYSEFASLVVENRSLLTILVAFIAIEWCGRARWNPLPIARWPMLVRWTAYSAAAWTIILLGTRHIAEFIYFQF